MTLYPRTVLTQIQRALARGKSVLLLGARQTGKTTLCAQLGANWSTSFADPATRLRYEQDPGLLGREVTDLARRLGRPARICLDEVQRWPDCLDVAQGLIDAKIATFVFTGSSARRLRRGRNINLLPGRVVALQLDPLSLRENAGGELRDHLLFGSLPGVRMLADLDDRESDLESYVSTYLEQEVRAEALVRNIGPFARFLALVGAEAGRITNYSKLSQRLGVAAPTVRGYYEILEDCLLAERIEPLSESATRHRLTRAPRHLLFDMGVRRLCAQEGRRLTDERMGVLFEHFVGLELVRQCRSLGQRRRVAFWRDPAGPEIDFVVQQDESLVPIEVKYSAQPRAADARHLQIFLREYPAAERGVIVCQTPRPYALTDRIRAVPWQELPDLV